MTLSDHLLARKDALAQTWFDRVLSTYPQDAARLLSRNTGSFANPVGQTLRPALAALLEGLVAGTAPQALRSHLDAIVRVRAVQDFTPGVALVFLVQLKDLLREETAGRRGDDVATSAALRDIEDRIDGAMLMAFDLYTSCREQVHMLKARQRYLEQEMATPGRPARRHGDPENETDAGRAAPDPDV
jgi:hypothetical protein